MSTSELGYQVGRTVFAYIDGESVMTVHTSQKIKALDLFLVQVM